MGGMSGRQGRFSGLVTEGMSSIGLIMGLAGLRWAWAPAILALVGLVGLALCRDATGKGPACPGLECCTEGKRAHDGWLNKCSGRLSAGRRDGQKIRGKKNKRKQHKEMWMCRINWLIEFYQIFQVAKTTWMHIHAFGNQHMLHKTQKWQSKKKGAKPLIAVRNETFGGSSQIL